MCLLGVFGRFVRNTTYVCRIAAVGSDFGLVKLVLGELGWTKVRTRTKTAAALV